MLKLIPQQASFRPGKSCTGQLLNPMQHVENGYEANLKTGVVFVDLSAAFDTVNHRKLLHKIFHFSNQDTHLTRFFQSLFDNRRFYAELNGLKSRSAEIFTIFSYIDIKLNINMPCTKIRK